MRLSELIVAYKTDPDSPIRKLRYCTRQHYVRLMDRIDLEHGHEDVAELRGRDFLRWHEDWSEGGKIAMGHALVGMVRTLFSFGFTILDSEDCLRLSTILSKQRFEMGKPRVQHLTSDQVDAVCRMAHAMGFHSVALGQRMQYEVGAGLRQKDVIGEWEPLSEPTVSSIEWHGKKWVRGLTWDEIDGDLVLRHVTSKKGKPIEAPLSLSPALMEEFARFEILPERGPIIISEIHQRPYTAANFRRLWREIATKAGIPPEVYNMDSRAGGITESTDGGADLEMVRHAATHSNVSTTQRYSRNAAAKVASVMKTRAEFRAKSA